MFLQYKYFHQMPYCFFAVKEKLCPQRCSVRNTNINMLLNKAFFMFSKLFLLINIWFDCSYIKKLNKYYCKD